MNVEAKKCNRDLKIYVDGELLDYIEWEDVGWSGRARVLNLLRTLFPNLTETDEDIIDEG